MQVSFTNNFQNRCPQKPSNMRQPRTLKAQRKVQFAFLSRVLPNAKATIDELLKTQRDTIDVSFRDDLSEKELNNLKNAVGLKNLRCRGCTNLTNDAVLGFAKLSDLESLDISMNSKIDDSVFSHFSFKNLKELNLSETSIGAGLKTLQSKTLQTLILRKCPNVTLSALQRAVLGLPALQKLDITQWGKREGEKFVETLEQFCIIRGRKIRIESDYYIDTHKLAKQVEGWKLDDEKMVKNITI